MECRKISGDNEVICVFCEQPLKGRRLEMFPDRIFGYEPCNCAGYIAHGEVIKAEEIAKQEEMVAKMRKAEIDKLIEKSNLGLRFRDRTFETYVVKTEWQKNAIRIAEEFVVDMCGNECKQGLLLSGTVGTGKTHIAAAVANRLMQKGCPVMFGTSANLLAQIKAGWKDDSDGEVVRKMCRIDLLVIDDFGKEYSRKNADGWSWAQEQFFNVINSRYENYMPMVITTNFSMEQLKDIHGEAIVSRLVESCRGIKCDGEDWRMKRGKV